MRLLNTIIEKMGRGVPAGEFVEGLCWRDFEVFAAEIFSENGFAVKRNLRFSAERRRFEIDVAAFQRPRVVLVDCKHWGMRAGKSSGIKDAAARQRLRAHHFEGKLIQIFPETAEWGRASIIPVIVTLHQEAVSEHSGVFVVPVFKLNQFIEETRCGIFDAKEVKLASLSEFQHQ
ncbi:MAG: restriction endonuclease [Candidatus Verstraetearchaeota archaeon]|nr:restriction endonuclease [Candidatus Verstraetearchaeota archaeon]